MPIECVVRGVLRLSESEGPKCLAFVLDKAYRVDVRNGRSTTGDSKLINVVHSDVWGPQKTSSFGGSRYFIKFIDFYLNYVSAFL